MQGTRLPRRLRVAAGRAQYSLGWAGMAGVALLAAAAMTGTWLCLHPLPLLGERSASPSLPAVEPPVQSASGSDKLPPADDIPLILTRIQRTAVEHGLGWPRADYRVNPATDDSPASLDVHCVLKGPYPQLRAFVTAVLLDAPSSTLKEFNLSRPSAEAADVEAKLSIVVYVRSATSASPAAGLPGAAR